MYIFIYVLNEYSIYFDYLKYLTFKKTLPPYMAGKIYFMKQFYFDSPSKRLQKRSSQLPFIENSSDHWTDANYWH